MNSTIAALQDLRKELTQANAQPVTIARTATEVLERSGFARLDLAAYLGERGYDGVRRARAIGTFGKAVRAAYEKRYGLEPLDTLVKIDGAPGHRIVRSYLEVDRPLIDEVFAEWSK